MKLVEKEIEDVKDDDKVEKLTRQKAPDTDSYSNSYKLGVIACMILGGSLTTIFAKVIEMEIWLPKETVNSQVPNWVLTEFKHPLIMNLLKFAGESILLPILSFKLIKDPEAARSHAVNKINPLIFMAPAMLDTFGSCFNFTGLLMIAASTY